MKPSPDLPEADMADIYVSAVMPCLNEEKSLGICIEKILRRFRELGIAGEVVIADNGSTDRSVELAESLGARVVHESRKGYGSALMAGIGAARGHIVVMADSDDSYDWLAIGDFVAKIEEGYDLVVGNRFQGGIEPGAMPPLHRYLGNPVLSGITRTLYRIPLGDFHCGMRAIRKKAFLKAAPRTPGMEFATEMIVAAAQAGLTIGELPTKLYPDKRGRRPHLRSFRDGWRHLRFMLTYAPDYLYLAPGSLLFALGILGMAVLAAGPTVVFGQALGIHFLALAALMTLLGLNIAGFGIFAKVLNSDRFPIPESSLLANCLSHFSLERGLMVGGILVFIGLGIDFAIFAQWIARAHGMMNDTVHVAFIATSLIVVGINILFGAFLLSMIQDHAEPSE